jgi:hypothetical protein
MSLARERNLPPPLSVHIRAYRERCIVSINTKRECCCSSFFTLAFTRAQWAASFESANCIYNNNNNNRNDAPTAKVHVRAGDVWRCYLLHNDAPRALHPFAFAVSWEILCAFWTHCGWCVDAVFDMCVIFYALLMTACWGFWRGAIRAFHNHYAQNDQHQVRLRVWYANFNGFT